ncbi:hypothetical protein F4774DRAFT_44960 [Daldinia eschscholtzii]|nr:hypothetical protein F4774DRAFT_44960 [Daldinia eschscholtzii]
MAVDWAISPKGYESQLVINHLGHFLFTNIIIPNILKFPQPHIVVISTSSNHISRSIFYVSFVTSYLSELKPHQFCSAFCNGGCATGPLVRAFVFVSRKCAAN